MNAASIGEKVRALRHARSETQKELAGTYMTRNMLSLIESGKVTPSLDTLCYLSERLDVEPGYLLSDSWDIHEVLLAGTRGKMKKYKDAGRYEEAIRQYEKNQSRDAETTSLYVSCCLDGATVHFRAGRLKSAAELYEKAAQAATDPFFKDTAQAYCTLIHAVIREEPVNILEKSSALPFLFAMMHAFVYDSGEIPRACNLYRSGFFREAEKIFANCLAEMPCCSDPVLRLFIYTLMESCATGVGDFEAAYTYQIEAGRIRAQYRK